MTNPLNVNLPHLGATGVVQTPGDLGAIAQAMSGLPAILQANQQLEAQRQRDALNQQYMQSLMAQNTFNQNRQTAQDQQESAVNEAAGSFLQQITSPEPGKFGWNPGWQADPMDPNQAIQNVAEPLRSGVLAATEKTVKSVTEARQKKVAEREQKQVARAIDQYMANPDALPSLIKTVPAAQLDAFVENVNKLKPEKGSWIVQKTPTPEGLKYVGINAEKNLVRPFDVVAPEDKGNSVTISMPSEGERRGSGLYDGAAIALSRIDDLLADGYDPIKESNAAKVSGLFGLEKMQRGLSSSQGRRYLNNVRTIVQNWVYTFSGAASSDKEKKERVDQIMGDIFDDAVSLKDKDQNIRGMVNQIREVGGRAVGPTDGVPPSPISVPSTKEQAAARERARRLSAIPPGTAR